MGMTIFVAKDAITVINPTDLIRSFKVIESDCPHKVLWITLKPQDYFLWTFPGAPV